ncbi:MAG: hypothetical protein ACP5JJ_20240, partial [Anaerolineae bacterium]
GDRCNRLEQILERREAQAQERTTRQASLESQQAMVAHLRDRIAEVAAEQSDLESAIEALQAEAAKLEAALTESGEQRTRLEADLAESRRHLERLQGRYELLSRLRAEGEGLHAGVRAVLQAARRAGSAVALSGIIGTVAQNLHVPTEYEVAIEVALGGHVQDIVVDSWSDAETAIAFLREGRRGRATFLPLDTVRPSTRLQVPTDAGVIGLAADLVEAQPHLGSVVE